MAAVALGLSTLIGWAFDIAVLKSVVPGLATMKPNTALGFMLAGAGLLAADPGRPGWQRARPVLAVALMLLAGGSLGEHLFNVELGIDTVLLTPQAEPVGNGFPGRMAQATALALFSTGLALALLGTRRGALVAQVAALVGNLIGMLAVFGYAYGVAALYSSGTYSSVAMHTAVGLVVVTAGILLASPRVGVMALVTSPSLGGIVLRRLLPVTLVAPFLIGWLRIQGERHGLFNGEFGVAMAAIIYVILLTIFVWRSAFVLRQADQRRQASELARAEKGAQLDGLVESAMDGIVVIDDVQRIVVFNPAAERMFGYHAADVLGKSLDVLLPAPARHQHAGLVRGFASSTGNRRMDDRNNIRGLRADGAEFPLEASVSCMTVKGRQHYVAILRDLSEQHRTQQALRDSEQRYRTLAAATFEGVAVTEGEHLLDVNPQLARMLGFEPEEMIGMAVADCLPPEAAELALANIRSGLESHFEHEMLCKDGSRRLVEARGRTIVHDGRQIRLTAIRDITESRRAEAAQKASEELYRKTLQALPAHIAVLGHDGSIVEVNEAWAAFAAANQASGSPVVVKGADYLEVCRRAAEEGDVHALRALEGIEAVLAGKVANFTLEYPCHGPDEQRWFLMTVVPLGEQGRDGLVITHLNITERKAAELALQESEAEFRAFFHTAACGAVILDMNGMFLQVNERYCQMTGYSAEELQRMTRADLTHPEDSAREKETVSAYMRGQTSGYQVEKRYIRKDGQIIWVEVTAAMLRDANGKAVHSTGIVQDITKRKQAQEALHESERRLRLTHDRLSAALQASPVVVHTQDRDLRYTWIENPALGYSVEEIIGKTDADLFERRQDAEQLEAIKRQVLASGQMARQDICISSGGVMHWYDVNVHPQKEGDEIVGILVTAVETTERRQVEDELRDAIEQAERANNAKSRFLAAASHDLRQPLSALSIYAGSLKSHVALGGQPMLANMRDCIASLSELLADLLDLSKLEAGVVAPNPANFPLADVLTQLEAVHTPEALVKGLRLRCMPTRWIAYTDPVLFQRLLGNLVANAIRYTDRGGMLIGCRRRRGKTWVEVWDTGIGIPQEKTGEIFEEFRQLDDDGRSRGSGLGLAIVARTAALLGLEIRVRSRPGRGSLFAIEVPPGQIDHAQPVQPSPGKIDRPLRIALVEDNQVVRESLVMALEFDGHQVLAAESGKELLRDLVAFRPDVLMSDYRLSRGETGFDVLNAANAALDTDLPAILLTGDTDPRLVRSMADRGVIVLHKPIDLDTLHAQLEALTSQVDTALM